jgi:L-rhamnose mutarotase
MTNELEKQFFDTFGIEPKTIYKPKITTISLKKEYIKTDNFEIPKIKKAEYPKLTADIYLELIAILTKLNNEKYRYYFPEMQGFVTYAENVKRIKERILEQFVNSSYKKELKHQVRTLFEEG